MHLRIALVLLFAVCRAQPPSSTPISSSAPQSASISVTSQNLSGQSASSPASSSSSSSTSTTQSSTTTTASTSTTTASTTARVQQAPAVTASPMEALPNLKIRTLETTELPASDNVRMVMMVASNGNKNPELFLPGSPLKELAQPGYLSALGKNQAFNLGTFMRQRYGQLISGPFNESEVQLISASTPAVQGTMNIMSASMFAPSDKDKESQWNANLKWNPVPMSMDDAMLNTHEQKCPALEEINRATEKLIEKNLADKKQIADFIVSKLGWNSGSDKLAQIGYNIEQYALRSLPLPDWMNNNPFNNTSLYSSTLGFRFLYQLGCAKNPECRHICSGSLLNKMANVLKNRRDNTVPLKMMMMTTNSDVLASLLWSMNIETAGVPSGRSLVMEYRETPEPQVRALFTEFIDQKPEALAVSIIRMPGCTTENEWCPMSKIMQAVGSETVSDWKRVCRNEDGLKCDNSVKKSGEPLKDAVGGFNQINLSIDCTGEEDRSGTFYCQQWAKYEYCKEYISVRDYYCRYTCLCDDKFRIKNLTVAKQAAAAAAAAASAAKHKAKH